MPHAKFGPYLLKTSRVHKEQRKRLTHSGQQRLNLRLKKEGAKRIGRPAGKDEGLDDDGTWHGRRTLGKLGEGHKFTNFRACNTGAAGAE